MSTSRPDRPAVAPQAPSVAPRRTPRNRDFGIGYGRSHGYARQARYTSDAFSARFRLG